MDIVDMLLPAFMGFMLVMVGGWRPWTDWRFFKRAIRIPGVVISYEEGRSRKGGKTYAPVIAFELDGEKRQVTSSIYFGEKPKMGTPYTVGIAPYNLEEVRVLYPKRVYIFNIFSVIFGIVLLALTAVSCFA